MANEPMTLDQAAALLAAFGERMSVYQAQQAAWVAGVANGGPNADGQYPFTQPDGTTVLVACPAWFAARSAWNETFQFNGNGSLMCAAPRAMSIIAGGAKIGSGAITYAKSTAAAPATFAAAALPFKVEAGAYVRVTAADVADFVAVSLRENVA